MSYNGSGTFQINSSGQPVITGTVISSTAFNALTADLATGLSTAITKDGQTTTTARITFAQGVSSTLVTDATSATTGSIITAGGISMQKALWVGTTTTLAGALTYGGVTLSNSVTGTGSMVLSAAPTLTGGVTATSLAQNLALTLHNASTTSTGFSSILRLDNQGSAGNDGCGLEFTNGNNTYSSARIMASLQGVSVGNLLFQVGSGTLGTYTTVATVATAGLGIGMTPSNVLDITQTQNAASTISIANTNAGGAASARSVYSNAATSIESGLLGSGYSTNGVFIANRGYMYIPNAAGLAIANNGPTIFANSSLVEYARIDTSGNLLVGQTSTTSGARFAITGNCSGDAGKALAYMTNTASANPNGLTFYHSGVSSGNTVTYYINGNDTGAARFYIFTNGNMVNTNNSYGAISDISLKENIVDATPKLADLMNVKIRHFNHKSDPDKAKQIGVVAQELETVFPGLIDHDKDGIKSVKYSVFVPMLIKAIQELTTRLAALENK